MGPFQSEASSGLRCSLPCLGHFGSKGINVHRLVVLKINLQISITENSNTHFLTSWSSLSQHCGKDVEGRGKEGPFSMKSCRTLACSLTLFRGLLKPKDTVLVGVGRSKNFRRGSVLGDLMAADN